MAVWKIYHKDGTCLCDADNNNVEIHSLEYSDTWMGECYITATIENATPIAFSIGDYLIYRGDRYEINYDPGKIKCSSPRSYGGAFKYDSVKFNSMSDELVRCEMLDVVLDGNELHYTALPKFTFYVQSIDDLLDRIQANLNEQIGDEVWHLFSRDLDRSIQRGCTKEQWLEMYGDESITNNVIDSTSITIDNQTCWDALSLVNSQFDINFITRGRNVYVGTVGIPTANIFKYGKGNGLYEIEQNSDSDQEVITRLRAYGSEQNLPTRYYSEIGIKNFANITSSDYGTEVVDLVLDVPYAASYFKTKRVTRYNEEDEATVEDGQYVVTITFDFESTLIGYVYEDAETNVCRFHTVATTYPKEDNAKSNTSDIKTFADLLVKGNKKIYFTNGVKRSTFPSDYTEYDDQLPNNMAVNRLMLPGFPSQSLQDFWDSLSDKEKQYVNPTGKEHKFSTDRHRPYIDSINADTIGVRQGSVFFDTDDKTNGIIEIYPSIEEMEIDGQRIDEIYEGSSIEDNGVFDDNETVPKFTVKLRPEIDFDINSLKQSDFAINMKDGMCGGRSFSVTGSTKEDGVWKLTMSREKDDALDLYFPYCDYQINAKDHFVLTGIELPDSYVRWNALKMLKYAIAYLDANDYTRFVYQPKVDEIFMARQHDEASADISGTKKSLHDTLKAGDIMQFEDADLSISGKITIDQLTIKEENGKIPTYEITLREDKEVGTIQKIQNQISSLTSGNGNSGGGATTTQVKNIITAEGAKMFLSKLNSDVSQGLITFLKGIALGADGKYGISEAGAAVLKSVVVDVLQSADYDAAEESGFGFYKRADGKYGLNITDVLVWGKAIFNNLEIRNLYSVGGSIVLSPSSGKIVKVAEVTDADTGAVTGWKCWMLADDGTMATTNQWQVGDQARCQTFNVAAGVYEHVSNKDYWRRVTSVSTENEVITDASGTVLYDGKKFAWVVLSKADCMEGSDEPEADDTIVCMGSRTVTDRQHLIMLATEGDDAPSLTLYRGVNSYTLTGKKIFHVSYNGIEAVSQYFKWTDSSGAKVWTPTYLGTWQDGRAYGYYDEVTWMGTRWLCVAPEGTAVTEEPSEDSSCWMAETAIVKPKLVLYHDLGAGISLGETHTITCRGMMGDQDITSTLTGWAVTRSTGDSVEDAAWLTRSKVKAFDGTFALTWVLDVSESDMGNGETAVFTFSAKRPSGETLSESIGIIT